MSLISLLFGFKGRINRLQYWLGSLGVGFGAVIALFTIGLVLAPPLGAGKDAVLTAAPLMLLLMGLTGIAMGWAGMALQVKRFHDRNQPGMLVLLPLLPMLGLMFTVIGGALAGHQLSQVMADANPYVLTLWAINLFFFINLGCLAGTDGPNKYGDPPGAPPSPGADPQKPSRAQAQAPAVSSLGSVEAAMERAIAEKARKPIPAVKAARPAAVLASAPAGAAASFGRRPAR